MALLLTSLEDLISADNPTSSYPFFYSPGLLAAATSDGEAVFRDLLSGFPLVGPIPADPSAPPLVRPSSLTPDEVLARAPQRTPRLVQKGLPSM